MTFRTKILGSALAATFAIAISGSASAATIIEPVFNGPLDGPGSTLTIEAVKLIKGNTYDYLFSIVAPLTASASGQVSAQVLAQTGGSTAEPIEFSILKYIGTGTPTAAKLANPANSVLLGSSTYSQDPTLSFTPSVGTFFVQILSQHIAVSGEADSGSIIAPTAVPEPATWGAMLVGFGAIGASIRRARRRLTAATA